jgi:hypothetical protein
MRRKVLSTIVLTLVLLLAIINLVLGFWGVSSILLTITIYGISIAIGLFGIKWLPINERLSSNLKLSFLSLMISLFAGELGLKYIFKKNLQKEELDGGFFFSNPYGGHQINHLARKYILGLDDPTLINAAPNSTERIGETEFVYTHNYNSLGLRGREYSKVPNIVNIVTLGDSYTEGIGTPEDSTWSNILESKLMEKQIGENHPKTFQVLNGGLSGSDPFAEYFILKKLLLQYKPRFVVIAINQTDITDVIRQGGFERNKQFPSPPWWTFIYQFSTIFRAIIHTFHPVNWLLLTESENYHAERVAINKLEKCLTNEFQSLSNQNNFQIIVVLHPLLSELESNKFSLCELEYDLSKFPQIKVVNLFNEFKKVHKENKIPYKTFYWPKDGHHNSYGYFIWAKLIANELNLKSEIGNYQ